MLHSTRGMPSAMATLHRLLGKPRFTQSGKVPTPISVISRAFSQRPSLLLTSRTLSADIPVVTGPTIDNLLIRSYATATKKKSTTAKKKTTKKKAPTKKKKAAKKPKKTVKKKAPKKKAAAKPKKPTRPKVLAAPSGRGISGYVVYIQNHLKSSSPGLGGPNRLSEAVQRWKELSDAEKDTWKARAESVNETRKQEYANFLSKLSPAQIKEENAKRRTLKKNFKSSRRSTRLLKDPNAPKKPTTAYLRFFTETYEPGAVIADAARAASSRWKSMSDADKASYVQAAEADKARYLREKTAYESS